MSTPTGSRQLQIGSQIRRTVQTALQRGLADPRVRGLVTVTRVDVSPDLRHATMFVSIMPEEHAELTMHGLRHATPYLQSQVASALSIRRAPKLSLRLDRAFKRTSETLAAIQRASAGADASADIDSGAIDASGEPPGEPADGPPHAPGP